jgi:hypothetical protein
MSHPRPFAEPTDDEISVASDLFNLDVLVHRYPDEARDLVARLAEPTPLEQAIMDEEAASLEEQLA